MQPIENKEHLENAYRVLNSFLELKNRIEEMTQNRIPTIQEQACLDAYTSLIEEFTEGINKFENKQ